MNRVGLKLRPGSDPLVKEILRYIQEGRQDVEAMYVLLLN
jgi:hypothetical protein